jgi:hypothetical protein
MFANANNFILDQKKFKLEALLALSKGIKPHDVDGIKANLNFSFWEARCKATEAALLATFGNCSEAYKKWVKDRKPMAGMDEWVYKEFLTNRHRKYYDSLVEGKEEAGNIEIPHLISEEELSTLSIGFSSAGGQSSSSKKTKKKLSSFKVPVVIKKEQPTEAEAGEEKPLIFGKAEEEQSQKEAVKANPFSPKKQASSFKLSSVPSLPVVTENDQPTEAAAVEEKPLIFGKSEEEKPEKEAVKANPFVFSSSSNNKETASVVESVIDSLRTTGINSQEQLHRLDLIAFEIGKLSLAVSNLAENIGVMTGESEKTEPFNPLDVVNAVASSWADVEEDEDDAARDEDLDDDISVVVRGSVVVQGGTSDQGSGSYTEETVKSDPEIMKRKAIVSKKDGHLFTLLFGVAMTLVIQNKADLVKACLDVIKKVQK